MSIEEVVKELESRRQFAGDHLWRLNTAIFNCADENEVTSQLAGRIYQVVMQMRKEYQSGQFYATDQGNYLALLGTLQNQDYFSTRQATAFRGWIAEALGAGREGGREGSAQTSKDKESGTNGLSRSEAQRLRKLEASREALAAELRQLRSLRSAVETFTSFDATKRGTGKKKDNQKQNEGPKDSPQPVMDSGRGTRREERRESVKAEPPGYQVRTDSGWIRYDDEAQTALRAAAEKGQPECEIFAQGQYYKISLKRMVQINPSTGNERSVRLQGEAPRTPEMPKLNFKRLMVEFKQLEACIAAGQEPSFHRCEPVEDNLMDWEMDMSFPAESALQKSLENLAASMFDSSLNKITFCIRFPVEFPLSPPEVWLRRPRMRYRSGQSGPVTFGGRVCSMLLASAGWQPATSMLAVLKEVQQSLVDSGIEANTTVCIKKEYPRASIQLQRLNTELFPTVNGFCQMAMTAISPEEASAFLGDLSRLEATDKIGLPFAYANSIYKRAELGADLVLPLVFELKTLLGRKTHCAIFEFIDGLPDNHVLIPKWVMEDLAIDEREPLRVRGVDLDLVTAVKVQPHSVDFYQAVRDSGRDVRELLTESLSRFSTLTEDTAVPIEVGGRLYQVQVITVEPHGAVRIIDMDVQHHFEFKVEFEPAPDLEDEAATKEFQDRALKSVKLRRERSAAGRQEIEERRREARQKRYEGLVARESANVVDKSEGTVEVGLRMPDGSQLKGKFPEGASVSCLMLAALESPWAKAALPWGIYLRMAFPKKVLASQDVIDKGFHRSTLSVQEEQAPEKDEELFAVLRDAPSPKKSVSASGMPEELAPPPLPERDESELFSRTQRAFEMQRFLRAGFNLEEAEKKFQAGEILPPTAASRRPEPRPPAALAAPAPASPAEEAEAEDEKEKRIEAVVAFTGADREVAKRALEENQWIEELAVNKVLDSLDQS
ncbi:Ubiquitin fusion degradation protein 1-like [Symbiodinium microadriaticum]|uniref:Ubiquitin fusion degradation protein 1-like n=2 Tax=Symbiodinium TaxID=2949 RepID=A0A1Q9DD05_SYMMI|nr:Ubiquitin fusion degradation protein 1-like [Symbiodinium microadriaticum]